VKDDLEERARNQPHHDCTIINLSTVTPKPISWLWPGRIPLGMFVLIAGQPGVGKTTISHSIAAILSTGGKWPFSDHRAAPGTVIILTAEDDPKYTLVPRLMAAGADLKRINLIKSVARQYDDRVIDAQVLLSEDMHQLHGVLEDYPDTKLLILDPLSAYLGVKDSHRDADVRQVLGPLTDLAASHGVTVLGITHLSKNTANSAMSRFMGSTGIIAAARAAFLVAEHEEQLLMLPVKSNVAKKQNGLVYKIQSATVADNIETSCIEWIGETDLDADDALASQAAYKSAPKKNDAIEFLNDILKDGPVSVEDIYKAAEKVGIAERTIRRAYDDLSILAVKENKYQGKYLWYTQTQQAELQA
jgi:putative DNA primase/helicase